MECDVFQMANLVAILVLHETLSLPGVVLYFLDVMGTFFAAWMVMDGLVYYNYHWIFWCCVMLPMFLNIILIVMFCVQMRWEIHGGFYGGMKMVTNKIMKSCREILDNFMVIFDSD